MAPERKKTTVIAEIGSNHNQDFSLAGETIDAAVEAGADAVKFQSINADELYYEPDASLRELHRRIDLEESWHGRLKAYCDRRNITFFSSPTYLRAIDILEDIGVTLYKLASAQIGTFPQIIRRVARTGKPTLFSTGIVTTEGVARAVDIFEQEGNSNYTILHCNSIYPVAPEQVHLGMMERYGAIFGAPVGFSDHSEHNYLSFAAVARGARVIERHFTLDKALPVPDAAISLDPAMFSDLVKGIREIEIGISPSLRHDLEPEEARFREAIRYRLVLACDKMAGEEFHAGDFRYLRHGSGVDCMDEHIVLDQMQARRDLARGELMRWSMMEGRNEENTGN